MPVYTRQSFIPPAGQANGHLQTIVPSMFRKVTGIQYTRERINLQDGDFLDLDWMKQDSSHLIILTHGLEGHSHRHYITGTAKLIYAAGFDVLAWNCRSCSGEMNRTPKLYHHGDIHDIREVIMYALKNKAYKSYSLVGYSMGGNISIKYAALAKHPGKELLNSIAAVSTPMDLRSSIGRLEKWPGKFYGRRFFKKLEYKIRLKSAQFPDLIDASLLQQVRNWKDFDSYFSAPMNGYEDEEAFYDGSSAINFLEKVEKPLLLIHAQNDPILGPECHPVKLAEQMEHIHLDLQYLGGHTGFVVKGQEHTYAEMKIRDWMLEQHGLEPDTGLNQKALV